MSFNLSSSYDQLYSTWHIIDSLSQYNFYCSSVSYPGVNLTMYDSDSLVSLVSPLNSYSNQYCNQYCNQIL